MKSLTSVIRLVPLGNIWHADWSLSSDADIVTDLFGTTLIPTAFTLQNHTRDVQTDIQKRNPAHSVVVVQTSN